MLQLDVWNVLFTIINLLILFVLMRIFLYKPVQKIIAKRQEEADRQFGEAAAKQSEAEELKTKYQAVLSDAENEKKKVVSEARKTADEEYQRIVTDAHKTASQIKDDAEAEAISQKEQILKKAEKEIADMATRSIQLNNLQKKFDILNCNIKDIDKLLKINSYDAIVTNPPYKKPNSGKINENKTKLISRHEIEATLDDFIRISFKMLKDKGKLYMVHRAERIVDILSTMRKYKIEPKRIRFVFSNPNSESKLVLIEATKNAKSFVKIEKPLYVYNESGHYTQEILQIYNK